MPKAATFQPLTNRTSGPGAAGGAKFALPEDGFVQLVPMGSAPNVRDDGSKDGMRIIQLVDATALDAMLKGLLNRGGEMLVDFEHFSHELDKPTDAAAWVPCDADHLQNREDGLYGKPRWSNEGEAAVLGGRLRYISPEFPNAPDVLVNVSGQTWRPLAVTGFGLTNRPGFRKHAKALTNSGRRDVPADNPEITHMHKTLLALALGLPETELDTLTEDQLRAKVQEMKDKLTAAEEAAKKAKEEEEANADAFMKKNEALPPLKNKEVAAHLRTTYLNNRAVAEEMVKGWMSAGDGLTDEQRALAARKPLHNRQTTGTPPAPEAPTAKEEKLAAKRGQRANEILRNREESSWSSAFARACAEVTE